MSGVSLSPYRRTEPVNMTCVCGKCDGIVLMPSIRVRLRPPLPLQNYGAPALPRKIKSVHFFLTDKQVAYELQLAL